MNSVTMCSVAGRSVTGRSILSVLAVIAVSLPSSAYAHVGAAETSGFLYGLSHPFGGLDHICAMLAVGLWAAQTGGRSLWVVPLTFVGVMALGGLLPVLGISLPWIEQGIVLSVLLLGVLIAASIRLPLWLSSSMVSLFALWHGHAHGAEMPVAVSGLAYAAGFVLATISLHATGMAIGVGMQRRVHERLVRAAGAGIALCGVYLAVV
ncbi:MAG: HupE/UreJ family protein [Gallionella sp.]|nr:HupE/UreJ family protein [Gallionella sp.]